MNCPLDFIARKSDKPIYALRQLKNFSVVSVTVVMVYFSLFRSKQASNFMISRAFRSALPNRIYLCAPYADTLTMAGLASPDERRITST